MEDKKTYNSLLAIYRIAAIIMVLSVHVRGYLSGTPQVIDKLLGVGAYGVALYFMLSGYFTYPSIKKSGEIPRYYAKRAVRILPMYYISLLLTFIVGAVWLKIYPITWEWIYHVFFLNMFVPGKEWMWWNSVNYFWTMPAFAAWYIISPLFYIKVDTIRRMAVLTLISAAAAPYIKKAMYLVAPEQFVNWNFFCLIYVFFLGVLAYLVVTDKKIKEGIIYGVLIGLAGVAAGNRSGFFIFGMLFYCMIICMSIRPLKLSGKLSGCINAFSSITYSIYLTHWFVIQILGNYLSTINWVAAYLLFLGICIIVGGCAYICIEKPIGRRLNGHKNV